MSDKHLKLWVDIGEITNLFKESQSVEDLLQKTVILISKRLQTVVCSIYLYQKEDRSLILAANTGLSLQGKTVILKEGEGIAGRVIKDVISINLVDGNSHQNFKPTEGIGEEKYTTYLALPILSHKEKIGVLVLQKEKNNYFTEKDELALRAVISQLKEIIQHAKNVMTTDVMFQSKTYNNTSTKILKGKTTSKGIAIGHPIIFLGSRSIQSYKEKHFYKHYSKEDFLKSLEKTQFQIEELQNQLKNSLTEMASMVFVGYQLILKDKSFRGEIITLIESGTNPPLAIVGVALKYINIFSHSENELIAEKTQDVEDISLRLLGNLLSEEDNALNFKNKIVITEGLYPSDLLSLKSNKAKGIIMYGGGVTAHISLIARSLNIPMVLVDKREIFKTSDKVKILLDAYAGDIYINPSQELIKKVESKNNNNNNKKLLEQIKRYVTTRDGVPVHLYANINLLNDIEVALLFKTEGIGLYRTELPFMIRNDFPTEEEQFCIYKKLFDSFPNQPVTIRTLDIGGDKHLPYQMQFKEANPFLGVRSIRFSLKHEDIFITQLRAILRAGANEKSNLQIMFPMISSLEELQQANKLLKQCINDLDKEEIEHNKSPRIGIMVEVPSAVEMIDDLVKECDFISIGTNDLVQYLLAADRTNDKVSSYYNPYHPAVLRAINRVATISKENKVEVSICGDIGSNINFIPFFIGIGILNFSIDSNDRLIMQKVIEKIDSRQANDLAKEILSLKHSKSIEDRLKEVSACEQLKK